MHYHPMREWIVILLQKLRPGMYSDEKGLSRDRRLQIVEYFKQKGFNVRFEAIDAPGEYDRRLNGFDKGYEFIQIRDPNFGFTKEKQDPVIKL